MDEPFVMRRGQPARDLARDLDGLACRERSVGQALPQGLPLEQFRHRVGDGAIRAEVVDPEHVRVCQCGQRLGFSFEPRKAQRIADDRVGQDLESDVALKAGVPRAEHLAHSAGTEGRKNFVGPQARSWSEGHREWSGLYIARRML